MSNGTDRREVQALTMLMARKRLFINIPQPKEFHENYDICKDRVTETIKGTQECIKSIFDYVQIIHKELEAVRQMAKDYNIQIGEYLKNNLPKLLNVVWTKDGTRTLKSTDIDLKGAKQMHEIQLLAKQQQDLMELIMNTESFIDKVEAEAELSIDDFDFLKGSLEKWADSLETEKERQQREKEERERIEREKKRKEEEERTKKEREEEEKRKREEEERKRKEEEKRRKEEEEKRKEEERIRRNPKNWKPVVYNRNEDNSCYHKGVMCVVKAMDGVIMKSDLCCSASDSNKDLEGCLRGDEKLVSSVIDIIHLKSTGGQFEVPIQIFIPCYLPDDSLEVVLKVSTEKDIWKIPEMLPDSSFKETPNVTYVGTELGSLQHVKLVAVSRFKRDRLVVDKNGHTYESDKDRNMKVVFPPNTFKTPTKVSMKVIPLKGHYLQSARKFHGGLDSIGSPSSLFEVSCDEETGIDILMELYGQGSDEDRDIYVRSQKLHRRPEKPKQEKQEETGDDEEKTDDQAEDKETDEDENVASDSIDDIYWTALKRCEPTLVTQLSINDVLNYLKRTDTLSFSSSKIEAITSQKIRGDQVREFIKQLSFLGIHAFDAFVDSLNATGQAELAELIKSKIKEAETNDNRTKGNLHVVYRQNGGRWNVMLDTDVIEDSGGIMVKLPAQNKVFEILAMTSPPAIATEEICKAAESLCNHTNETKATLICRQKEDNQQDVYIHCVRSEKVQSRIMELKNMGYTEGPAESAEFCVLDGEDIHVTFDLNIRFNCFFGNEATLRFYAQMDSARLSGNLEVIDERAQVKDKMFHGNLNYSVGCRPKGMPYTGSMALYLPKPKWSSDRPYYAPLTMNVPVQAVAKFIAFKFTTESQLNDKWKGFIENLESSSSKLRQIQTRVNKEYKDEEDRVKKEKLILNWAKERPVAEDKILSIIQALGAVSLRSIQTETKEFSHIYRDGGILSDSTIKQLVSNIGDHREMLSINLGVSAEERQRIKIDSQQSEVRALVMMDLWRLSDTAIEKGKNVASFLLKAAKDAKCNQSLLLRIQQDV